MPDRNPVAPMGAPPPENYERYFVPAIGKPLAHDLLRLAALRPGERVLDVGCGTGVVTRLAAQDVGAGGEAVGVDIEAGMLAGLVSGADASAKAAFEADALEAWARSSRGEGMELDQPMVYARALK